MKIVFEQLVAKLFSRRWKTMAAKKTKKKKTTNPTGNPAAEVSRLGSKPIKDPIRCGVVGLGRIGWCHHSQIICEHNGFELVAVCDLEDDRILEAQNACDCKGYNRLTDMLKNDDVELVVVATQSKDHEPMAIKASKAGKHVLVEKPSAATPQGIDRMIKAARKSGKLLTMHHNYRLNKEFLLAREVIKSGKIGEVFRIKRTVASFARRNDWQTLKKYGGGMTGNWGVHLVDQGLQLMNSEVKYVWGKASHFFNPGDAEDDIKAIIEGKNGIVFDIDMTSVDASERPSWIINGTWGTFWITGGKAHIKYISPKQIKKIKPIDKHLALNRKYGVQPGPDKVPWKEETMDVNSAKPQDSYYDNLYKAVRKGQELLVTPESARAAYDVLWRIKRGSRF